jgi:hypothetical protein
MAKTFVGSIIASGHGGARLRHRQDGVLAGDVGRDDLDHRVVHVDGRQVDRGNPEVPGELLDQLGLGERPGLDQVGTQTAALLLLQGQRPLELLRVDLAGLDEKFAKAVLGDVGLRRCHRLPSPSPLSFRGMKRRTV